MVAQVEKIKGRIRVGEVIMVTVCSCLLGMSCWAEKQGNGTIPGGRCLVIEGFLKDGLFQNMHICS